MSDPIIRIAEWLTDPRNAYEMESALVEAVKGVVELHRGPHTCRSVSGVTATHGGRDRPACATVALLARVLCHDAFTDAPVRTVNDVERLGPLGCKADVLMYGSLHAYDNRKTRAALEQWAEDEGVSVTWVPEP